MESTYDGLGQTDGIQGPLQNGKCRKCDFENMNHLFQNWIEVFCLFIVQTEFSFLKNVLESETGHSAGTWKLEFIWFRDSQNPCCSKYFYFYFLPWLRYLVFFEISLIKWLQNGLRTPCADQIQRCGILVEDFEKQVQDVKALAFRKCFTHPA